MIALILGGAPSVWAEAEAAAKLLNRRHLAVAANLALVHYRGRLDAAATLHPDLLDGWIAQRRGNKDFRRFTPETTPERWPGSSGLFALQVALFDLGATGAILCGIPQDNAAGSINHSGPWNGGDDYRRAFMAALPEVGGRVRSMGGWTAELFGRPTKAWVGAIDNTKPAGRSAPKETPMFTVKNTSNATQKLWARTEDGTLALHHLAPGESVKADIDPNQPKFGEGGPFKVTAAATAPKAKPAAKKKPAPKAPAPKAPAEPQGDA